MQFIINAIAWLIDFIVKKNAKTLALLPIKFSALALTTIAVGLYIGAYVALVTFSIKIINKFYDLITQVNNVDFSSSSKAYGISLSDLWNVLIGFLHASGIGDALVSALNLFIVLYFGYYAVVIAKMVGNVYRNVVDMINNSLQMFN
jgi:uncharacterized membrane protein YqhA